jgi:mono/diheme cytochrome c family protein
MMRLLPALFAAASALEPAVAADAKNGEQIARRWCSPCHVVASDQRNPAGEAPPFSTIARAPDFSEAKIAFFLLDPHPKMPDMGLSRAEAADLAAYMGSLR